MVAAPIPFDFHGWLKEHGHTLKPPVGNAIVAEGDDYLVMVVGGPNARSDFHLNDTEEWFYQIKGDIIVKIVDPDTNQFQEIPVKEGHMLIVPRNVPHCPIRFADTIGLVMERKRLPHQIDKMRWYCEQCNKVIYEKAFHCKDLVGDLVDIIKNYQRDEDLRKCDSCGNINPAIPCR
ncbi:3-hydroxyanthranilic acid dioxygenase [Mycoemilia scoparia]|uniref:3-hydroxyanthranilate 3,4-dioxygenase n=1 Tax=Mycoemilia scoparia TaxID=417184 RepID=A0A9W8A339_9FUNG|nr:3-hydroxyanthranilic acid dioxygenase [Mycoemilia scoparia]